MMKVCFSVALLFFVFSAFSELPILDTPFHKSGIEEVVAKARQDDPNAQIELALRYYAGYQVSRDPAAAFEWMSKAAIQGNSDAQFLLSRMYAEGVGTEIDSSQADAWFVKALVADPQNEMIQAQYKASLSEKDGDPAAKKGFLEICSEAGYVPAVAALGEPQAQELYARGDYRGAVQIFQQLAEKNSPAGIYRLAEMYTKGLGGLPEDYMEAFDLYSKAAEEGYPEAQYQLALMYETGTGIDENPAKAEKWYEEAAKNGVADAQYKVAEKDFASAVHWSEKASLESDDETARVQDTKNYKQNLSSAIEWYRKAAEGNSAGAQYMLGRLHASGEGVLKDFEKSLRYYKKAAEQKHADTLFYIGLMYHAGLGISKDTDKAIFFYQQAVERGSRAAMFYLGNCYCFGNGVEQHARKGESFYRQALEGVNIGSASDSGESSLVNNLWVLRAAREYAVILWRKAISEKEMAEAVKWMSLAARSGDSVARDMLVQMAAGKRDSSASEDDNEEISGVKADPRSDATAKRRDSLFLLPYLLQNIRDIYPGFKFPSVIADVMPRGEIRSITGDRQWELSVKYRRPPVRTTVGLRGMLLMGAEFEDTETGETLWAFNETKDKEAVFNGDTYMDASMFVDLGGHSNLRLRSWAVTYGHLFDDNRRLLAVIDERSKSKSTGFFEDISFRNRFSEQLDSTVISTINIDARFPGDIEDPSGGTDDSSDDDGLLDSILGTITGG